MNTFSGKFAKISSNNLFSVSFAKKKNNEQLYSKNKQNNSI